MFRCTLHDCGQWKFCRMVKGRGGEGKLYPSTEAPGTETPGKRLYTIREHALCQTCIIIIRTVM